MNPVGAEKFSWMTLSQRSGARLRSYIQTQRSLGWHSSLGTMIVRILGIALNLGVLATVAKVGGASVLGITVTLGGMSFVLGTIYSVGLPTYVLRAVTDALVHENYPLALAEYCRSLRWINAVSLSCLAVIAALALSQQYFLAPGALGVLGRVELLALGTAGWATALQFAGLSLLRALRLPSGSALLQFSTPPIFLGLCMIGAWAVSSELTVSTGALAFAIASWCNAALTLYWGRRLIHSARRPTLLQALPWGEIRSMWLLGMMSSIASNLPLIIGALFLSTLELAALGVPFRICNIPATIVAALGAYYAPRIREAHVLNESGGGVGELKESQWLGTALVLPLLVVAVSAPLPVLGVFEIKSEVAVLLLRIFAFAQIIIAGCGVSEQYLMMQGRSLFAAKITFVCSVLCLGLAIFGGYYWGAIGLGLAWAIMAIIKQVTLCRACYAHRSSHDPLIRASNRCFTE